MHERLRKMLREWNREPTIIKQCFEWVESIVSKKNRHLVSILLP